MSTGKDKNKSIGNWLPCAYERANWNDKKKVIEGISN